MATDEDDDSYDLSWLSKLTDDAIRDVVVLRKLLESERDPIDRHYMFQALEQALYASREAFESALNDFDETCIRHDLEMDAIRAALVEKFGGMPLITMYRQAAIRHQKNGRPELSLSWLERGVAVYGDDPTSATWAQDLRVRRDKILERRARQSERRPRPSKPKASPLPVVDHLVCRNCGTGFERIAKRGRKPVLCDGCREQG